jgi:cellulose biosynthesis protein BcsQ
LRVLAVLNLADPGDNRDTTETVEALASFPQFAVAPAIIRRRKAIVNAMAYGLAVAEAPPKERDPKACEEIAQLISNVFDVGAMANGHHKAAE